MTAVTAIAVVAEIATFRAGDARSRAIYLLPLWCDRVGVNLKPKIIRVDSTI